MSSLIVRRRLFYELATTAGIRAIINSSTKPNGQCIAGVICFLCLLWTTDVIVLFGTGAIVPFGAQVLLCLFAQTS